MSNDPSKTRERSLERLDPRSALPELREAMVPLAYAEKTMTALLRLHEDLSEEKERRIDLYRRLMDREQQLAELKAYVRLLEAERERGSAPAAAPAPAATPAPAAAAEATASTPGATASQAQAPAGAASQQRAAPSPQRAPAARTPARRAPPHRSRGSARRRSWPGHRPTPAPRMKDRKEVDGRDGQGAR